MNTKKISSFLCIILISCGLSLQGEKQATKQNKIVVKNDTKKDLTILTKYKEHNCFYYYIVKKQNKITIDFTRDQNDLEKFSIYPSPLLNKNGNKIDITYGETIREKMLPEGLSMIAIKLTHAGGNFKIQNQGKSIAEMAAPLKKKTSSKIEAKVVTKKIDTDKEDAEKKASAEKKTKPKPAKKQKVKIQQKKK